MPTREEWKKVHADLMAKLELPCRLLFRTDVKVGCHSASLFGILNCYIEINPNADFRVPEHLILHEAAHHHTAPNNCGCQEWHCKHWAQELCKFYEKTGVALPHTTGFAEFAKLAGIVHKVFDKDLARQMEAIAENPQLLEGA